MNTTLRIFKLYTEKYAQLFLWPRVDLVFELQISKVLAGADRKDLMRKLPKFIYDEEKALEVRNHLSLLILLQVISC